MNPTIETLGIDRLSIEDRLSLLNAIWDSISEQEAGSLPTPAQRRELDRRLAEHEASPDDVIPWERIKAEALARFRR